MSLVDFQNYYKKILPEGEFEKFFKALRLVHPKIFRVNTLKWTAKKFEKWAKDNDLNINKIPFSDDGYFVEMPKESKKPLGSMRPHLSGYGYIQGPTSMYPVEMLKIKKDDVILDMCSSPGGKTTHIAQKLKNTGFIIANEISLQRLNALRENIERLGVWNYAVTNLNPSYFKENYPNHFDKILVDAPCSGEGMNSKSEEVMKRWTIKYIEGFARMQVKILSSAFEALKPKGYLVYSTCTLNEIENEGVLEKMKVLYGDSFVIKEVKKFWPHRDCYEGFFSALVYKKSRTDIVKLPKTAMSREKMTWLMCPRKKKLEFLIQISKIFDFKIPKYFDKILLVEHENEFWLQSITFWRNFRYLSVRKVGVLIGKLRPGKKIEFTREFGNGFGHLFKNTLKFDDNEIEKYTHSNEIIGDFKKEAYVAIENNHFFVGLAKVVGNKLKKV